MRSTRTFLGLAAADTFFVAACGTTEDAASTTATTSSSGPVTGVDSRGKEVKLPGPAKRVAATEWNGVEHLVSLGVLLVGVSDIKCFVLWVCVVLFVFF